MLKCVPWDRYDIHVYRGYLSGIGNVSQRFRNGAHVLACYGATYLDLQIVAKRRIRILFHMEQGMRMEKAMAWIDASRCGPCRQMGSKTERVISLVTILSL
jgi:hypothetical protein